MRVAAGLRRMRRRVLFRLLAREVVLSFAHDGAADPRRRRPPHGAAAIVGAALAVRFDRFG